VDNVEPPIHTPDHISEIVLAEPETGGWVLFYSGVISERIFSPLIALKSEDSEAALEEVYDFFGATTDEERKEVLAGLQIIPESADWSPEDE